jgi:cystathionine gamma-synthase
VAHPAVAEVRYPGLPDHPGHAVALAPDAFVRRDALVPGARRRGGRHAGRGAVRLFTRATSLGGVESLIEHRASIEPPGGPTPRDLLRVSVGLEHPTT